MRGLNEDEVCDFVAMTEDKVSFTEESAIYHDDFKDLLRKNEWVWGIIISLPIIAVKNGDRNLAHFLAFEQLTYCKQDQSRDNFVNVVES